MLNIFINKNIVKYIISESQYKLLVFEQIPDTRYMSDVEKDAYKRFGLGKPLSHDEAFWLSLIISFMGPLGMGMATLIQGTEATAYFSEGKPKEGGLSLIFTLLPGIPAVAKIIGVSGKTTKFMKELAEKIVKNKGKNLTKEESVIVQNIQKNVKTIEQELNSKIKPLAGQLSKAENIEPKLSDKLKSIAAGGLKFAAHVLAYLGVEIGYNAAYDKFSGNNNQTPDLNIDVNQIHPNNVKAAKEINFY